ncbi:MAG: sulfatase-like hydrolase/transferase [Deltaproteobacteria bacterium]|nr:sulfatase-like hydrolase/transferase [Deltaproteobacteria bacterium]
MGRPKGVQLDRRTTWAAVVRVRSVVGTHAPYLPQRLAIKDMLHSVDVLIATLDRHRDFSATMKEMYRASVRHFDQAVLPRIIEAIKMGAGWDNTILAITSGYGESWGERYNASQKISSVFDLHGKSLYDEALRVPMVVLGAVEPRVVDANVTPMDLARTIAMMGAGDAGDGDFEEGLDLRGPIPADRPVFAVADVNLVDDQAMPPDPRDAYTAMSCVIGDRKVIKNCRTGGYEWYDLAKDPGELENLCAGGMTPPEILLRALEQEWDNVGPIAIN